MLYLDSIDTGVLNLEPHTLPRIKFFGHEVMRSMILADTLSEGDDPSVCHFGRSQVCFCALILLWFLHIML